MTFLHHLLCGSIQASPSSKAICHCLLLEDKNGLALIDTGIGLLDVHNPKERIGQELIDMVGFLFQEQETAVRQIEKLSFHVEDVQHAVLTHCDPDHTGGLADFPQAQIHVSEEELAHVNTGHFRYLPIQFAHEPKWKTYGSSPLQWFGLEARPIPLGFESEVLLIPLFGHTLGHCGVAIQQEDHWVLHVGDAYYLKVELERDDHPVSQLAAQRADNNDQRIQSLEQLKRLARDHRDQIRMFGYHDPSELPGLIIS